MHVIGQQRDFPLFGNKWKFYRIEILQYTQRFSKVLRVLTYRDLPVLVYRSHECNTHVWNTSRQRWKMISRGHLESAELPFDVLPHQSKSLNLHRMAWGVLVMVLIPQINLCKTYSQKTLHNTIDEKTNWRKDDPKDSRVESLYELQVRFRSSFSDPDYLEWKLMNVEENIFRLVEYVEVCLGY